MTQYQIKIYVVPLFVLNALNVRVHCVARRTSFYIWAAGSIVCEKNELLLVSSTEQTPKHICVTMEITKFPRWCRIDQNGGRGRRRKKHLRLPNYIRITDEVMMMTVCLPQWLLIAGVLRCPGGKRRIDLVAAAEWHRRWVETHGLPNGR